MDAGLLFFQAHRTSLCELEVRKAAANLRVTVQGVNASARYEGLCRALASLLKKYPLLYLVSAVEGGRLLCAEPVFRALHVPLDEHGEPEHVRRLTGFDACGYLLESRTQAIVLLPDLPEELRIQLPGTQRRLAEKFGLTPVPPPKEVDYEALIEPFFSR